LEHQIRTISFGQKQLQVPNLFVGYRLGDVGSSTRRGAGLLYFPWQVTETQALLVNAYDFLVNKRCIAAREQLKQEHSLGEHLHFDQVIMMDSGAYNFLQQDDVQIDPLNILEIHAKYGPDIGVVLDHPFPPNTDNINSRIDRTIDNTKTMYEQWQAQQMTTELLPVVHGHNEETLKSCLQRARDIVDKYNGGHLTKIGIGSLAPLAQNGSKYVIVDVITTVRKMLPEAYIHCFSLGSALHMALAFFCGADSVDSQSWIVSAAFKYVQIPGYPGVRISDRERDSHPDKYRQILQEFKAHALQLHNREGFCLKDWETGTPIESLSEPVLDDYIEFLTDSQAKSRIHNRACHNLWVYNFEVRSAHKAIKQGKFEQFVQGRLSRQYSRVFEYAREKACSCNINC